jgi:aldehyde dehydrogenase (NAD+)
MSDEIFGPILPIITVKGVEKAMDVILEFPKPLALYVFTKRKAVEEQFLTGISAGGVGINETISHVRRL